MNRGELVLFVRSRQKRAVFNINDSFVVEFLGMGILQLEQPYGHVARVAYAGSHWWLFLALKRALEYPNTLYNQVQVSEAASQLFSATTGAL